MARLRAVVQSEAAVAAAIFDLDPECQKRARATAPGALFTGSFEELLDSDLDGIVISTPNFVHAGQTAAALRRRIPVFCQKPLALSASSTRELVDAARINDRLLAVDFCYRYTAGIWAIKTLLRNHQLGKVYAAELVFHNAYGPDRDWYYDCSKAGGGCLLDLGIHLIDLVFWLLDDFSAVDLAAQLHRPSESDRTAAEDYASIQFTTGSGVAVRIACSWRLRTAGPAHIFAGLYGAAGGAEFRNVNGSFYDFSATHISDKGAATLASPPDDWGYRAILNWIHKLDEGGRFDPDAEHLVEVAELIDRIYHL